LGWVSLGYVGLGKVGFDWVGLGWVRLGWVGLGWFGLGWVAMIANFDVEQLMLLGYKSSENEPNSEFHSNHFHYQMF